MLKDTVERRPQEDTVASMKEIAAFSSYYAKLRQPKEERSGKIAERLDRLNRYEATTAYPFLLNVYHDYAQKKLSEADFTTILDMVESFLIRRFICGVATSGLTKIFPGLHAQAREGSNLVDGVRRVLRDKSFPRDQQFKEQFVTWKLYGGDRSAKAKLILERLEMSFAHKEPVDLEALTIEHVLPRTPTEWWREHLGEDWEAVHEEWLDTVGNLTLTGYNSEMSNSDFPTKRARLQKSHVELNKYFAAVETWDEQAIARRGEALAERAVAIWPDFAHRGVGGEGEIVPDEDVQEDVKLLVARVIDAFGGEKERLGKGSRYICRVGDGKVINIKYSKQHTNYYWFGLHQSLWEDMGKAGVTHVVFILVPDGFVTVPVAVMKEYIAEAGFSPKSDGTVRHYHVLISRDTRPELFHHGNPNRIPLKQFYTKFAT